MRFVIEVESMTPSASVRKIPTGTFTYDVCTEKRGVAQKQTIVLRGCESLTVTKRGLKNPKNLSRRHM